MTVKNISEFHLYNVDELKELSTRHLKEILDSARGQIVCSCGKGHHCGDDVLDDAEIYWNEQQNLLVDRVKVALENRENIVSTKQVKKKEKKVLKY